MSFALICIDDDDSYLRLWAMVGQPPEGYRDVQSQNHKGKKTFLY
jgi:hypothetical protein